MNISRYQLNHPKAYLGYTIALYVRTAGGVESTTEHYVTSAVNSARRGAQNLGLVELENGTPRLTEDGETFCEIAPGLFDTQNHEGVLQLFDDLRGARSRFCEQTELFEKRAHWIGLNDPTIERLVNHLDQQHWERTFQTSESYAITTSELYEEISDRDPSFAEELFKSEHGWRSSTTFQLKNVCWHLGILQQKGVQAKHLDPDELTWALEPGVVDDHTSAHASTEVKARG